MCKRAVTVIANSLFSLFLGVHDERAPIGLEHHAFFRISQKGKCFSFGQSDAEVIGLGGNDGDRAMSGFALLPVLEFLRAIPRGLRSSTVLTCPVLMF